MKDEYSNELIEKINNNDESVVYDKNIHQISSVLGANDETKNEIYDYYLNLIADKKPANGKKLLDNGVGCVPKFTAINLLTLGITYLIKLAIQGNKDYQHFKQNEPIIANNCRTKNIDYVSNNNKDNIKDITKGIALYHEISEMREKLRQNDKDIHLSKEMRDKSALLSRMCQRNKTLNTLINSDKPSCALANGMFHVGIIASRINNGKKEFFLIDQGGRKVPGSGFPNDDEFSKSGINVAQVSSTNGMCMATAEKGLLEISTKGLDNYLMEYANIVQKTSRQNVLNNTSVEKNVNTRKMMICNIGDLQCNNFKSNNICNQITHKSIQVL